MKKGSNKSHGAARRPNDRDQRRPGPFKPTIKIPRSLPVASSSQVATATKPPVLAAGTLEQIGHEADEALALGKRVLNLLNVEAKEFSYNVAPGAGITYAGTSYLPLAGIGQGDTDAQRNGDSIGLRRWRGTLALTRGGTDSIMAYAFVQEGPSFISALQEVFEGAGTANAPLSQPLWDSRKGFRILKQGIHALTTNDPIIVVPWDMKFKHDVQYYNNTTTVYEGGVSLYVISSNAGGGSQPTISFDSQLSWVDN